MKKFQLFRGDDLLGIVTHAPEERIDGGHPWDVGWLESAPRFAVVRELFEQERRHIDAAIDLESKAGSPTVASAALLGRAAEIQRAIVEPGLRLLDLAHGKSFDVIEIHMEGSKVFWR